MIPSGLVPEEAEEAATGSAWAPCGGRVTRLQQWLVLAGLGPQSAYRCPPAQESRPRTTSSLSPGSHASASSVRVRLWNVENATVTTIQSHCLSGGRTRAECRHVGCLEEGQASHEELASSSEPAAFLRRETTASSRPGSSPAPLPPTSGSHSAGPQSLGCSLTGCSACTAWGQLSQ